MTLFLLLSFVAWPAVKKFLVAVPLFVVPAGTAAEFQYVFLTSLLLVTPLVTSLA